MNAAAQLDELQRRLTEAEETLRAIREGEVDALVVRGVEDDEVFHLGGDTSYRAFMEVMDIGAAALDEEGGVLYANNALCGLLGASLEQLRTGGLAKALGAQAPAIAALAAKSDLQGAAAELRLGPAGGKRHVLVKAAPLPLGFSTGRAFTFTDITDRVATAAAEETQRVGRAVLDSAIDAVVVCDVAGRVTQANPAALSLVDGPVIGMGIDNAFDLTFASGSGVMTADDIVAVALGGGTLSKVEASLRSDRGARDVVVSAAPVRFASGAIGGCIVTFVDMTERKSLEKRQALLMRELDHRMKNMLTLVSSISARTLSTSTSLADFGERFSQRMAALAATQTLLADRAWQHVGLGDLMQAELAPFLPSASTRVSLDDLEWRVSRDTAVAVGLVFHELVTNAVKYGALSVDAGKVRVTGARRPDGSLEIVWREEGGPAVEPPARSGFGQILISRGLGQSAALPTQVEFLPGGVVCTMVLSPAALVTDLEA